MANAVPRSVNLSLNKPTGLEVYRQRTVTPANNLAGGSALSGSFVNITLNTAQLSTMIDTQSTYLQFDLNMTNTNPYVDYQSFGMEGAAAILAEMRIFNQGNPLEEILDYNLASRCFTFLSGSMQSEFEMFMQSQFSLGPDHFASIKCPSCGGLNPPGNITVIPFSTSLRILSTRNFDKSFIYKESFV